jgi:hypothetical protein
LFDRRFIELAFKVCWYILPAKKSWQNDAKTTTGGALLMLYAFHTRFIPVYIPAGGKLARRLSRTVQKRIKKGMQGAHPLM